MRKNNWMQNTVIEIAELSEIEYEDNFLEVHSEEELKSKLASVITFLIDHNFEKLLWILYRIDVDEEKAKELLSKHLPEEAPDILAELIIQRQKKKEEFKKQFHPHDIDKSDEDLRL